MKTEDIIRMAKEAGAETQDGKHWEFDDFDLIRFFALAAAAERDECANICDSKAEKWRKEAQKHLPRYRSDHAERDISRAKICEDNAVSIRARGQS